MHFTAMKAKIMAKKKLKHRLCLDHKLVLAYLGCGMSASSRCLEKKPVKQCGYATAQCLSWCNLGCLGRGC